MTRAIVAALAVAIVGIAVLAASVQKARAAFPGAPANLAELEGAYLRAPHDAGARAALVRGYLAAKAPGAASALLTRELAGARANGGAPAAELLHLAGGVEYQMGHATAAVALEAEAKQRCVGLPLCVDIERRHAILQEFVRLGVEDPIAHPEESAVAYQRAGRGVTFSSAGLDLP
jgi:hypothetical protein